MVERSRMLRLIYLEWRWGVDGVDLGKVVGLLGCSHAKGGGTVAMPDCFFKPIVEVFVGLWDEVGGLGGLVGVVFCVVF